MTKVVSKVMKDSGIEWLGDLPEHWGVKKAKYLFQKIFRDVQDSDEIITCFRDGVVTLRRNRRLSGFTEALKEIGYQGIRCGDLVIHQMDAFAGAVGISDSNGKGSPVYSVCIAKVDLDLRYYVYIIKEMSNSKYLLSIAKGIRERSTDFRFDTFANLYLPIPPIEEQIHIANYIELKTAQIDGLINQKKKFITELEAYKSSLISEVVTKGLDPSVPMKDSGIEWLGDIPEHWEVVQLKYVADIFNGATPSSSIDEYWNGDINWITPTDIGEDDKYINTTSRKISISGYESCGTHIVPPNSIILTTRAPIGKVCINSIEMSTNQGCKSLVLNKSADSIFIYYKLKSLKDLLNILGTGTTFMELSSNNLANVKIPLPPLPEQQAIATYLDAKTAQINHLITQNQSQIQDLESYKISLISEVVTGKKSI